MFKKLKKIIQIMTDKDISEIKEEYSNFSYQWIKGDNLSQTQHFEDLIEEGGRKYILFTDKTRIALDLLDEYMIRVERGFEEKRESETGKNQNYSNQIRFDEYNRQKLRQIELLRSVDPVYKKYYKDKANEYFNRGL